MLMLILVPKQCLLLFAGTFCVADGPKLQLLFCLSMTALAPSDKLWTAASDEIYLEKCFSLFGSCLFVLVGFKAFVATSPVFELKRFVIFHETVKPSLVFRPNFEHSDWFAPSIEPIIALGSIVIVFLCLRITASVKPASERIHPRNSALQNCISRFCSHKSRQIIHSKT